MRRRRDTGSEMADPRFRLDAGTADRVLEGRVAPDDAPPGYAEVAGLLQALAADLPSRPSGAGEGTVRMMARVVGISDSPNRRRRPRPHLRGPIVALAMVVSLGTTGVAFAGGLPDAAQRVVSTWFQTIGVTIPRPDDARPSAPEHSAPDTHAAAADARAAGPAARGTIAPLEEHRHRAADAAAAPRSDEAGEDVARPSSDASDPPIATPNEGGRAPPRRPRWGLDDGDVDRRRAKRGPERRRLGQRRIRLGADAPPDPETP
jgi:hypothetical protein